MKDHSPLCIAIVDAMLLLESASPNEINPDVAVRGMGSISSSLLMLDEDDQVSLRFDFQRIADLSDDAAYANFVRALPDMIGSAR